MDDYDDYYEVSKPRLQVLSGAVDERPNLDGTLSNVEIAVVVLVASALLVAGLLTSGVLQIIFIWLALSIAIGPFAPLSYVGGDCRVGIGEPVIEKKPIAVEETEEEPVRGKLGLRKRSGAAANSHAGTSETVVTDVHPNGDLKKLSAAKGLVNDGGGRRTSKKGGPWTEEELEGLRKGMVKFPRGTLKRWEVIAEAIGTGRSADEIVRKAKEMSEKKPVDEVQSFASFMAQRKKTGVGIAAEPSLRTMDGDGEEEGDESERVGAQGEDQREEEDGEQERMKEGEPWNDIQDVSLVRAMKEFPKDTPMRWDRIASAVPGKTKAHCMKRFVELKKGFRDARGTAGGLGEQSSRSDLRTVML